MFFYHKLSTSTSGTASNSVEKSGSGRSQTLKSKTAVQLGKRAISAVSLGLALSLLIGTKAEAVSFSFAKVVDTNTPIPRVNEKFLALGTPMLDQNDVAFYGFGPSEAGIYIKLQGTLYVFVDTNTRVPGGNGSTFFGFREPSMHQRTVAFVSGTSLTNGVYKKGINSNAQVVDDFDPQSSGDLIFKYYNSPSIHSQNVAYRADYDYYSHPGASFFTGIFKNIAGVNTEVESLYNSYISYPCSEHLRGLGRPIMEDSTVVFDASGYCRDPIDTPREVIFRDTSRGRPILVDSNTPIPGGSGNFTDLFEPSPYKANIAFIGVGAGQKGVYTKINGTVQKVADLNTRIPGGVGNFTDFTTPSFDNNNVAFLGYNSASVPGIYTNIGGTLRKVIAPNDSFAGKTVSSVLIGKEALSVNSIAFQVVFTDGSYAIYVATAK